MKHIHNKRSLGFTLVEILVVLTIVAGLTAVALPRYFQTLERFRAKEAESTLKALYGAEKRFFIENSAYTSDATQLDVSPQASQYFNAPIVGDVNIGIGGVRTVSTIARNNGAYNLGIREDNAGIICWSATSGCDNLGYSIVIAVRLPPPRLAAP